MKKFLIVAGSTAALVTVYSIGKVVGSVKLACREILFLDNYPEARSAVISAMADTIVRKIYDDKLNEEE